MKTAKITLAALITIIIAACSTTKNSTTSNTLTSTPSTGASTPAPTAPLMIVNPAYGMHKPRNEELTAIQVQYKDVTLEKLSEGHAIYTEGACIKCHGAINIYNYGEVQWKGIIDNMAEKAWLTDPQKDAVYKYVLAIKATQPKEAR